MSAILDTSGSGVSFILGLAGFFGALLVLSYVVALGIFLAHKTVTKGQPKKMSAAEQKQRRDSRTDKLQSLTLKNLSEADGYEYRRLLAQEKNGITAATERLDQLETMAHMALAAKEVA